MSSPQYNEAKHEKLLAVGRKIEKKLTHQLEPPFCESIMQTLEFFGADDKDLGQIKLDLYFAKFKIWDAMGMWYSSEYFQSKPIYRGIDKLVDLYIKMENVGGFAWFLRGHDLDVQEPEKCADCIKSYNDWHNETPEQRAKNQKEMEEFYGPTIDTGEN